LLRFRVALVLWCYLFEGRETSGIRTPRHNRDRKGVEYSAHQVGLASDVSYFTPPPIEKARAWAQRLGLRLVREKDHDHLQPRDWTAG
jgi:hypothetical protein